jgi:predicted amidohydrolase YtcJ
MSPVDRLHPFAARAALLAALLCAACAGPSGSAHPEAAEAADQVLRGGTVYTVDAARSWAQAVAIRGERIVYVGPDAGAERFIGPRTRVVDLGGRMLLPGFQDAHIHPVWAGVTLLSLALHELATPEEYVEAVAAYAAEHPERPWIVGGGWLMSAFPGGIPDRRLLDAVVPERPVALSSTDGHSLWVNSKALELAGITRETPDPVGGRIDRDASGEPVGALQERAAALVTDLAPPLTSRESEAGLRRALEVLNGFGITSFQDASVPVAGGEAFRALDAYRALDARGELSARVVASLWWERGEGEEQLPRLLRARSSYSGGRLRATTVKIMQDGVLENHTAALLEPYQGGVEGRGMPMLEPELLERVVTRLDREGFQVHFHAIGDAAIRQCLDAVEAARRANGARDARHHVSHLQLIDPVDIPRFRSLGVVANFQPIWAYADDYIVDLTLPFIGPARGRWLYPIGSVVRSGAVVAFGSDWDVSSPNPLEEIEVAITRLGPDGEGGEPFVPEERIDLHDALAAFTIAAAYVNFQERETGSIEVGKLADLVVLDENLFAIEPSRISEVAVRATLVGGQLVHGELAARVAGGGAR